MNIKGIYLFLRKNKGFPRELVPFTLLVSVWGVIAFTFTPTRFILVCMWVVFVLMAALIVVLEARTKAEQRFLEAQKQFHIDQENFDESMKKMEKFKADGWLDFIEANSTKSPKDS